MSSSEDSDSSSSSSSNGGGGENDVKMRAMLADWDSKDPSENNDVYVDSDCSDNDDDDENETDNSKRIMALRKTDSDDDVVDASEEEDVSEEEVEEEDVSEEEVEEEKEEEQVSDEEESDEDEEEDTKPAAKAKVESKAEDSEEEQEESEDESEPEEIYEEEEVVEDDEEEEEDEDDEEEPVVAMPPQKAAPHSAPSAAVSKSVDEADDERDVVDDGNIEDTLKKKPKKKKEKVTLAPITAASADDTDEDAAMKALLQEWGGDGDDDGENMGNGGEDDDDDDSDDDDEDSEASERLVQLEDNVIDHIVLAAPDLEEAMEQFEKMTGIGAKIAGSINGLGIKCARISFNDSSYIEIIAPDPKQSGPIGQLLKSKGIKELTPFHFAIRSSRAEQLKEEVKKLGYIPDHITMFAGQKDGTPKKWEMLYLYGHKIGGICPYFINWANSDHPCSTLPVVGKLKKFTIRAPEDDPVHKLFAHVNVKGFNVEIGKTKLSFQFSSPEGTIKFATSKAVGFKFPGFDDEDNDLDGCASDDDDVVFNDLDAPELLDVVDQDYDALPPPSY